MQPWFLYHTQNHSAPSGTHRIAAAAAARAAARAAAAVSLSLSPHQGAPPRAPNLPAPARAWVGARGGLCVRARTHVGGGKKKNTKAVATAVTAAAAAAAAVAADGEAVQSERR